MLNLNSTIDLDFKSFTRWWLRELDFLVPEKVKRIFSSEQGVIIIKPEYEYFTISYSSKGQTQPLIKLQRDTTAATHYSALLAKDERLAKAVVILRLSHQDAISKELSLPVAAKENLQQVVAYELDRYTPFKAEQVYFAVKTEGIYEGQIKVMLVLATREAVNTLYDELKAIGIVPLWIDYDGVANDPGNQPYHSYNLLPEWLQPKKPRAPRLIHSSLITLVILLLLATLALPVWFQYKTVKELEAKTLTIEKEAKKIKLVQNEIDALMDETAQLIKEKTASPPVVKILNTLSALIKDDTWLAYVQYSDGHLQLQGESPASSALIGVLESSKLFDNAVFVSPVTQESVSKLERFQISVDVNQKGETDEQ